MRVINSYRNSKKVYEPNTFIGGVGATSVTSEADFAAKSTLSAGDISNFTIDGNNNVSFYAASTFSLNDTSFENDVNITWFYSTVCDPKDGCFQNSTIKYVSTLSDNVSGFDMFNASDLQYGYFREATKIGGYRQFSYTSFKRLYFAKLTTGGTVVSGGNSSFAYASLSGSIVYAPSGYASVSALNTFFTSAAFSGATIKEVTDFSTPTAPTSVSVTSFGATYMQLSFTAGTSSNSIDFYEVWLDSGNGYEFHGEVSNGGYIIGLSANTSYKIKIATCDEFWNGSGFNLDVSKQAFSNEVTQTTAANYTIPTANIVSYWNFDSNSNDQVGTNDGTDTSISYVSGLISNAASFNGSSSKITIPDDDTLSFPSASFSISCWVYLDTTASNQFFYGKRTSTSAEYQLGYISGELRFRLFGGTTTNALLFNQSYALTTSTWHHIVITYDNTDLRLYIDGINVPISQSTTGTFTGSSNTSAPLIIGQDYEGSSNWFDGLEDEFSIFDIELIPAQVSEIYAKNQAGQYLTE